MYGFKLRETGEFTTIGPTKEHVEAALVQAIGGKGTHKTLVLKLWGFVGDIVPVTVTEVASDNKPMEPGA